LEVTSAIFQPRLISAAGLAPPLARGPPWPHRIFQRWRLLLVAPNQRVLADLLTGSAPSISLLDRRRVGAILLTTDGGAHWKAIPSPLAEDLGGVFAPPMLCTPPFGTFAPEELSTSDGGLTWTPFQAPERGLASNPAAQEIQSPSF